MLLEEHDLSIRTLGYNMYVALCRCTTWLEQYSSQAGLMAIVQVLCATLLVFSSGHLSHTCFSVPMHCLTHALTPIAHFTSPQPYTQGAGGGLAALLGPERMAALLPKLYRLTHDPSPKVRPAGTCDMLYDMSFDKSEGCVHNGARLVVRFLKASGLAGCVQKGS